MADSQCTVETPLGVIEGNTYTTVNGDVIYRFLGIPYAEPPVEDLRFKDPVPIKPWDGVLNAQNDPPAAPSTVQVAPGFMLTPNCAEDCLYLNLYTPLPPQADRKLPVMVYIHGGGFIYCDGNQHSIGPDYLVPEGIILVCINYRLGPLGFLSLETEECSGNYGLKDQSLALRWVQQNISAFGGDPENVTAFGESAGSASVHYHMLSECSQGLFQKAILQSGSALNRWAKQPKPRQKALLLAKKLSNTSGDISDAKALDVLRAASMSDIMEKAMEIFDEVEGSWAGEHIMSFAFSPTREPENTPNAFITVTPDEAQESGQYADIPTMIGACSDEGIFCVQGKNYVPTWNDDAGFQVLLPKELEIPLNSRKSLEAARKLREFYFPNANDQEGYVKALSAVFFTHGIWRTIKQFAQDPKRQSPNYIYVFAGGRERSIIKMVFDLLQIPGTGHAGEQDYLFRGFVPGAPIEEFVEGTLEHRIHRLLVTLWTDFAKNGTPSPDWPATTPESFTCAHLTDTISTVPGFFADEMKFWDDLYEFMKS